MLRTTLSLHRRGPPLKAFRAREDTYATLRAAVRVQDRCHAHGSRVWTGPGHYHHRQVTSRPYTGLTVTFPAQPRVGLSRALSLEVGHGRSVPRTAVGHYSRVLAHHLHGVGAGAGCALSRPSWADPLAQRPRLCDNQGHFVTPAASSAHEGQPTTSPRQPRDRRQCHRPASRCRR